MSAHKMIETTSHPKPARRLATLAAVIALATLTAAASTVTGTITNKTIDKPSEGDTIAAINLAQGMDEIAKATSDSHGKYRLTVPDGGQILLHITHKGAEYFARVTPGTTATDVDVYDSATHVDGLSGEAIVLRAETDPSGKTLNMGMNMFVSNASTPPLTEFGGNTFDFYLPKGAMIVESLASAPGGMPTQTPVKSLDNNGHYAFTFPIRPGETRFQLSYTLPYSGKQSFAVKQTLPTADVAIMLPKSIKFEPGSSTHFQPINDDVNPQALTYDAHQPAYSQPVEFTISGTGQLPQVPDASQGGDTSGGGQAADASAAPNDTRPGGGMATPIDTPGPLAKYQWWILGGLALALFAGAGFLLAGRPPAPTGAPAASNYTGVAVSEPVTTQFVGGASLSAVRDELFQLETERLQGKITPEQYAEHKGALDILMRRALARQGQSAAATPLDSGSPFQSVGPDGETTPGNSGDPVKT